MSIVETLKEFRTILLGQQIIIHTDHENLTYKHFNSDCGLRWRLFVEEYSPDIRYIKGELNVPADALSRLEIGDTPMDEAHFTEEICSEYYAQEADDLPQDAYPLSYQLLGKHQTRDKVILKETKKNNSRYAIKTYTGRGKSWDLICYNNRIVVPKILQYRVVKWYHDYELGHPGINRTEETIGQHLWWPKMRSYRAVPLVRETNGNRKSMVIFQKRKQKPNLGTIFALI